MAHMWEDRPEEYLARYGEDAPHSAEARANLDGGPETDTEARLSALEARTRVYGHGGPPENVEARLSILEGRIRVHGSGGVGGRLTALERAVRT